MKFFSIFLVGLLLWPLEALTFMVAVGVIHGEWLTAMPTVGFVSSLLITLAIGFFTSIWRTSHEVAEEVRKR